ncbi:TPA: transcriptional regulator [Candidatus Woesearchaeota archaeon]|nr:transcriptional regulator [Candidatus Woesearchaeota archaeon]
MNNNKEMNPMIESETIELKKSTSELKEGVISIVSILNKHHKGKLYFGITNNGRVVGQQVTENTLREVSKAISEKIEPKIYPEVRKETIDGKDCVAVEFKGENTPYFAYGRAYMRVADEDRQISAKELENIILKKSAAKWDSIISDGIIDEIDEQELKEFVQKANQAGRIAFKYSNRKNVLEKLSLIKDGRLLNAAKLLFSKKEPIELQAAVFAGTDKTTFLDIKQFKGNIFQLLKISEAYIKEHINWKALLKERTRQEIPEIPIRAITEALVNSFCHRDYQAPESNKIAIYKDRIEIWNPGEFPDRYKPDDYIKQELPSILRNPMIANCLYLSADIEKWGSGLKRINMECKANNLPVKLRVLKYGFSIEFTRQNTGSSSSTLSEGLSEGLKSLLNIVISNPGIKAIKASELLVRPIKTIERQIKELKQKGLIERRGSKKTGGYWIVKQ